MLPNDLPCQDILDAIVDGVYIVDRQRRIVFWNKAAERLTGFTAPEVLGKSCQDNILNHVDDDGNCLCTHLCPLAHTLHDGMKRGADVFLHHKEGFRAPVAVRVGPLLNERGEVVGAVEIFSDNASKMAALERMERLVEESLIDALTGVGNRRYAEITLRSRFDEKGRYDWPSGVLFCDLDHFKNINDTFGHDVGDKVPRTIAQTMTRAVRSFDFVGRWGGEEFLLCLPNIASEKELAAFAERLRALVENSVVETDQGPVRATISIGATILREDETMDTVLQRADRLLYQSKHAGRNRVTLG